MNRPFAHQPPTASVWLSGSVDRVTFHDADSGFAVLKVTLTDRRDTVTVVGHVPMIVPGEQVQASGAWVVDRTHGPQFKASWLRVAAPASLEGIEKYLASGLIKGIGKHYARRLTEVFGVQVFEVIERDPTRLRDVDGIGPVRARRIAESWSAQRSVRDIMVFLHAHGVGTSRAARIYKTYGSEAIARISENPYGLARDIRGIGFLSADKIAERLGIAKDAPVRVRAGVTYALARTLDEGHCGCPVDELVPQAASLLSVSPALVREALAEEVAAGHVIEDAIAGRPAVFLPDLHAAESLVASAVARLRTGKPPWPPIDVTRAAPWAEQKVGLTLAEGQRAALALALSSKALVVTGGPGVGKTTVLKAMLSVLRAKGVRVALCAPTGRAARRLADTTGLEAKTIHRLLEVNPRDGGFRRCETHPLDCDLLVVDETSMVDVLLMAALLRALPPASAVWLVGDADQLPSVGPGQVLADVLESGAMPTARLTEVFRQASESHIIRAAHRINRGEMPELAREASDFLFVDAREPDEAARLVVELVARRLPARMRVDPIRDVQVLCPMNRGTVGARALNLELQRVLNPAPPVAVERFGSRFAVGDRVMQTENDYDKDVYNGDLGIIAAIDIESRELTVVFDQRPVVYELDELDRLVLGYATTIHKSQGSEYPVVVVPITTQHYVMLQRRLLYTAVTRGKRLVVLVGQPKALALAVRGREARTRWSRLGALLRAGTV